VLQKADEDYRARTQNPRGLNPQECTFVAVTARQWDPAKLGKTTEEWRNEKLSRREWKDVMLLDAVSLEEWLNQNEAVGFRIAVEILNKLPPEGVRSTTAFWKEYSCRFKPQLREEVLLADRQDQANQLISQLTAPGPYVWKADSEEEVIAFAVAAIRKADAENRKFLEARTLVLDTEAPARQLSHKAGMVFLPMGRRT